MNLSPRLLIIDRCVTLVYAEYLADPDPAQMPIFGDLYDALGRQEEKEAKHIRSALEIYVPGSLSVSNHRTNVDITNRTVCYDIKELGKPLNISSHKLSYVTGSGVGEGLLFYGNVILPFVDKFPKNTELSSIMTTKLDETRNK